MEHQIDKNYFPGFTRKAVTFTIDDGNVTMDKKFLDIVRPAGVLGTFNLCGAPAMSPEEYREMYRGYEIANHVKLHPNIFKPGVEYPLTDEAFNLENADTAKFYRHPEMDGVYFSHGSFYNKKAYTDRTKWWFRITDTDTYIRLIDMAHQELEAVFGEGSVRSFVWPFGKQIDHKKVLEHVKAIGYYGARDAGTPVSNFSMPSDRMNWKYCAHHENLLSVMSSFEELADEGNLKFFSLGVHSIDFEVAHKWDDLRTFCEKYGGRPNEFYYATVGEIFDYEDAIKELIITDEKIINPSHLPLFIRIDGDLVILAPESVLPLI